MQFIKLLIASLILLAVSGTACGADYDHGHQALQLFDGEGFNNAPQWIQIWIGFMMLTFVCGVFFIKNHPIARWVVGGMVAGMVFGIFASSALSLPALSGFIALIHIIFWSPGLYQLLSKRPFLGPVSAFSIWSAVMTAVILFSFVFDFRDAFIYLQHVL